jgi:hypothetical protein
MDLKRALPPYHSELHYDLSAEMKSIKVILGCNVYVA